MRAFASLLLVAALIALSAQAFRAGTEGTMVSDATAVAARWRGSKSPTPEQWREVRERAVSLVERGTDDPTAFELLAVADSALADATARHEYLSEAVVQLRKALELRPMSPYTWSDLAAAQYRLGDTGKTFRTALVHATELGQQEPEVQVTVSEYGLAVWNEVDPRTQASIES